MADINCWLQNVEVQKQLEDYFSDVDRGLSTFYENQPTTAEPQLDGHLAARLEREDIDSLNLHLQRIERERSTLNLQPLRLKFDVRHITSDETNHGADIGFVLRLELPGEYTLTKAALIQTKRLYPNTQGLFSASSSYPELFKKRTISQWERMLNYTPASFYLLYNPHQLRLKRTIRVLGTRVISAQNIAGFANTSGNVAFTASTAYERGKPLAQWLVEDFICCRVGDTRQEAIETAYGRNPSFPVRSTIEMVIEGGTVNADFWTR